MRVHGRVLGVMGVIGVVGLFAAVGLFLAAGARLRAREARPKFVLHNIGTQVMAFRCGDDDAREIQPDAKASVIREEDGVIFVFCEEPCAFLVTEE